MGLPYPEKAEIVINKYARNIPEDKKQDLRQECYKALFEQAERISSPAIAYLVCRDAVFKFLRREIREQKAVSMSDQKIQFAAEEQNLIWPKYFLDRRSLGNALNELELDECTVIMHLYGLAGDRLSLQHVADIHKHTIWWVREKRDSGLKKLEKLLGAKHETRSI